jgi:deoxycytidylate deaminase
LELVSGIKGKIAYAGENQHRQKYGKIFHTSLHAEMNVLHKFLKKVKRRIKTNTTLYVVRILDVGFGNSKPCSHCQSMLKRNGIRKIKYTDRINNEDVLVEMKLS